MKNLNEYQLQYINTALWSSMDQSNESGGEPMDANYSIEDIDNESLNEMVKDADNFYNAVEKLLNDTGFELTNDITDIAHDFWLTRNHHGAGFWDGDYSEELGELLTELAHSFGEADLYIGDDGKIHQA